MRSLSQQNQPTKVMRKRRKLQLDRYYFSRRFSQNKQSRRYVMFRFDGYIGKDFKISLEEVQSKDCRGLKLHYHRTSTRNLQALTLKFLKSEMKREKN